MPKKKPSSAETKESPGEDATRVLQRLNEAFGGSGEVQEDCQGDFELAELYRKKRGVEEEIIDRKRKIGSERGDIAGSIDELVCKHHPNAYAKFKVREAIPLSAQYADSKTLNSYVCAPCERQGVMLHNDSYAYDCPDCGVVRGKPIAKLYDDIRPPASGSSGINYQCRICDVQLGQAQLIRS